MRVLIFASESTSRRQHNVFERDIIGDKGKRVAVIGAGPGGIAAGIALHDDMAAATLNSYRKILDGIRRPHIGHLVFQQIRYSHLIGIADATPMEQEDIQQCD